MSSLIRRLQIRILKRKGCVRETWRIINGEPVRLRKGEGRIILPDGAITTSTHWPRP